MSDDYGTPQRLYLFQLGTSSIPTGGKPLQMSMGCYLVQTSTGKNILIDSGLPPEQSGIPGTPPAENEKNVLAHLADLDLAPADIDAVIATHFDVDHAGYHDAFPQAQFYVQREHYTLARGGHPRFAAARDYWDHPALQYRLIDGDAEIFPGITVLETGGHVPAHQSVLVRLPQSGPVLLAIDAVAMAHLFKARRTAWPTDMDQETLRASTQKLLDLVERENIGLVVFGHDGAQWQTLKKAPDFYA